LIWKKVNRIKALRLRKARNMTPISINAPLSKRLEMIPLSRRENVINIKMIMTTKIIRDGREIKP
jgi:hypothetical protein